MKALGRPVVTIVGAIAALGLAVAVGYLAAPALQQSTNAPAAVSSSKDMTYGAAGSADSVAGAPPVSSEVAVSPEAASSATTERMVVSTGSMELRVTDADASLAAIRAIAAATNSEISNLVVTSGEPSPQPEPLTTDAGSTGSAGPVTAQVTLRVPADKLTTVEQRVAKLGTVLSQSTASDDVTQQHVDMSARLKNLKAEEARLRTFLTRTTKVSELLEVERELARVRGEIESLTAQLTYLERQAAMATLTIALSEPGPVVSPGTGGWGLAQAVTDGVRSAAALIRATITVLIAVAPVAVLLGIVVLVAWLIGRRRRANRSDATATDVAATDVAATDTIQSDDTEHAIRP